MALTPEQNEIFDAYDRMFATDGWKMLIDDLKRNQEDLGKMMLSSPSTNDDLWFCKGRNDVFQTLIGLESMMEQLRKMTEAQNVEADPV